MFAAKSLVIVDLQPQFQLAINKRIIEATKRLINQAKEANAFIFLVEYADCGTTLPEIKDEIGDYSNLDEIIKFSDAGGEEVASALNYRGLNPHCIVCGVNTYACVLSTVRELIRENFLVDIALDGCRHKSSFRQSQFIRNSRRGDIRRVGAKFVRSTTPSLFGAQAQLQAA